MQLLTPSNFPDYELIDTGNYEKLERFGQYILVRPEPQAIWDKALSENEWEKLANALFRRDKSMKVDDNEGNERGEWQLKKGMPGQWFINYAYRDMKLKMRLGLTSFKHVGIFPEQASNWNFIYDSIKEIKTEKPKVLNLFAYTGGASLAACAAGAEVTHVDSVKQVITWSRENMEASGLDNIRWIVEDALKYVTREAKRGNKYHGIILDPPKYGRGPDGEKWMLEKSLNQLIKLCSQIIEPSESFVVLNLYSMGFSALITENLLAQYFNQPQQLEKGELFVQDNAGRKLPLGVYGRFRR